MEITPYQVKTRYTLRPIEEILDENTRSRKPTLVSRIISLFRKISWFDKWYRSYRHKQFLKFYNAQIERMSQELLEYQEKRAWDVVLAALAPHVKKETDNKNNLTPRS